MTSVNVEDMAVVRDQVRDELRRADTKATTLLSLVGVTLAGIIALSGRSLPTAAGVTLWLSALPIAASAGLLLCAVRPRLPRVAVHRTWLHAARTTPAQLLQTCTDTDADQVAESAAEHVCRLARYAEAKYRHIARAVTLLLVGLGGLAVALLLAQVTA